MSDYISLLDQADKRVEQLEAEIESLREQTSQWREEAWQCYIASGADPDGADARHLNLGEAQAAVRELMRDYKDALEEIP